MEAGACIVLSICIFPLSVQRLGILSRGHCEWATRVPSFCSLLSFSIWRGFAGNTVLTVISLCVSLSRAFVEPRSFSFFVRDHPAISSTVAGQGRLYVSGKSSVSRPATRASIPNMMPGAQLYIRNWNENIHVMFVTMYNTEQCKYKHHNLTFSIRHEDIVIQYNILQVWHFFVKPNTLDFKPTD